MFEEPFRLMEEVAIRHSYVQEKLQKGQPVIAVPFNEGVLLLGFAPQPGKIAEIYDRIAMGGLGHPADVERLRMTLLEMAHMEGFNRSASDVNLLRLLQFGIAPALKQNFEELQRSPYLVQLILTELDRDGKPNFYRLNYDGYWETFDNGTVIAGNTDVAEWIGKEIEKTAFAEMSLESALEKALLLWREGQQHSVGDDDEAPMTLEYAFDRWPLEAAVLNSTSPRKVLYKRLSPEQIEQAKSQVLKPEA
jgi:proteasome alpha subunit